MDTSHEELIFRSKAEASVADINTRIENDRL